MISWILCGILSAVVAVLILKIILLKKAMSEICEAFSDCLSTDTNILISVSSGDRQVRRLAAGINEELRQLREQRRTYQNGDARLKEAVTNISHDLRTPLTAVCGYLELLDGEEMSETAGRYVAVIKNRAEVMKQLTEELFRYSMAATSKGAFVGEKVVVNHLLEESVAAFYGEFIRRGIVPEIKMPEKSVVRYLDASALSRLFSNLLANAVRYSDGDLDITLTEAGEITFTNMAADLDEVQTGRLFDRFYTVENARKSTGLGLSIAKTLVEQMHGSISASYQNNRLCIRVQLPE